MKLKKVIATGLAAACALSLAACGSSSSSSSSSSKPAETKADGETAAPSASGDVTKAPLDYASIVLGETEKDLTAEISFFTNRTDMDTEASGEEYSGVMDWKGYIAEFNKVYPNITVKVSSSTNYYEDAQLRLSGSDAPDLLMIPSINKKDYSQYFVSYGDLDSVSKAANYVSDAAWEGQVYGIPCTAATRGIVYNKRVFSEAGITDYAKTPEEFLANLQKIKDTNPDCIPLYTNYAAGWTMGAWDDYIGYVATGDSKYMNQTLVHTAEPFADPGDGTGAYNVYKILYDAVQKGLTEEDYTTTDWEGSKGMLNRGEIGCMVLGSWSFTQMVAAGDNGQDIGYMPFPISVNGEFCAPASPDYKFGINKNSSEDKQKAAEIFVKWITDESGFSYNEGGLPITTKADAQYPDTYKEFGELKLTFVPDESALQGEESYLSDLNKETELNIVNSGNEKVQKIIEAAAAGESFDDIMAEWNTKWSDAQKKLNIEQK